MRSDCLVCGAGALSVIKKYPGLLQCKSCAFITADISLSESEAELLYGKDYFHGQEYSDYTRDKEILQKNFLDRMKTLDKYKQESHKRLFEIGCAYGFFLDAVKDKFESASGVDISADAVSYAVGELGADAEAGNYLSMEINPYDVCCMWDTIEHVCEPERFVEKISKEISPDGLLAITTSDISSLNAKIRGKKWRQIHPPTHLHYFSVATLSRLLNRFGFSVIHVSHPGNLINVETALYTIFSLKRENPQLYKKLMKVKNKVRLLPDNIPVNTYDFMFVIAKKDK